MASIKRNYFYSTILTGANYVFPLIVFPYVSRVLGVANIGTCNFVDSIVNYFCIFSMLGINVVGVREIAEAKQNKEKLNSCFSSIFAINTILTSTALLVYITCSYAIPKLHEHIDLMWIGAIKLCFNYLLVEWLFKGLEEFKFITSRTLIIKTIYVVSVFLFVKKPTDYGLYFFLTSMNIALNAIVNCLYARRYISLDCKKIDFKRYLSPIIILGIYAILTNMYTTFNVAFLGFQTNEIEVGYYSTAYKIFAISLSIFSALTGVMLPRMSSLIAENRVEEYRASLNNTTDFLMALSFPAIIFVEFFAPDIILIISGKGYEGAIVPLQIMIPLLFIIGYEQILVIQGLMPLKKDNSILMNSIVGAVVSVVCNMVIVPCLKSSGSAIVWMISELSVLLIAQFFMKKYMSVSFPIKKVVVNLLYIIPLALLLCLIKLIPFNNVINMVFAIIMTGMYVIVLQIYIIKNLLFMQVYTQALKKIRH